MLFLFAECCYCFSCCVNFARAILIAVVIDCRCLRCCKLQFVSMPVIAVLLLLLLLLTLLLLLLSLLFCFAVAIVADVGFS